MIIRFITILSIVICSMLSLFGAYTFKANSVLADGKWVKIEAPETGLYSISYDQLKEMGFENPENVGVYGKGGRMMNLNFSPSTHSIASGFPYADDLAQVSSYHSNNQLIFWAEGTEAISFDPGTSANGNVPYFLNHRRNIYSKTAYYFLSDRQTPKQPETAKVEASDFLSLQNGWGYVRHEIDLEQNSTNTGKLFWGESFLNGNSLMEWDIPVRNMGSGTAHLVYQIFSGPGDRFFLTTRCNDKFEKKFDYVNSDTDYFFPLQGRLSADPYKYSEPDTLKFSVAPASSVKMQLKADNIDCSYLNLDYWILTYPKQIKSNPLAADRQAEVYYFKGTKNSAYKIQLDSRLRAFNICNPQAPVLLPTLQSAPGHVGINLNADGIAPVVFFDPTVEQKKIGGWTSVVNNNLHGLKSEGAELLIITVPKLRQYAERLADLHRLHDGIKVVVATPEEIYNEFSGGIPDPMAYRAIVKHYHGNGLKNLLLFGPSTRNMLVDVPGETAMDHIIALQHSYVRPEEVSVPAYEFYGVVKDNPSENILNVEAKEVGVGLLSCETPADCERILRKIERYLTAEDQAWTVNETFSIGGLGNEHLHDSQAVDIQNLVYGFSETDGMAHNTLIIDAVGELEARNQFKSFLDRGKIWNIYFGHGSASMLGYNSNFFTTGDLQMLKNSHNGFIFLGGCDFSTPDMRVRGIGESFVLDTDYGMIGAIVSSRTAWSSQNKYLGDKLMEYWLKPKNRNISPTIGEIFAGAKSGATALNHISFVLACDPALRVPSPLRKVYIAAPESASPGEKVKIEGFVVNDNDEPDADFNGKIVLKLMEPATMLRSRDYVTDTCNTPIESGEETLFAVIDVPYESSLITALEATVSDGKFEAELMMPAQTGDFIGQTLNIKVGVFDKSCWLGGAGIYPIEVVDPNDSKIIDTNPPAVNFNFDNSRAMLAITLTDDEALSINVSSYSLTIDGKTYPLAPETISYPGDVAKVFNAYCSTFDLPLGKHEAALTAYDIAGNRTDSDFSFEISAIEAPLTLTLDSKVGVDSITGTIEGDFTGALIFEIRNAEGRTLHTFTADSSDFNWDLKGDDGKRVPIGYYRISARSASGNPTKYSDWVEFAVL